MAAANAQIGVAQAAFFPTAIAGGRRLRVQSIASWLTWPGRFWSLGPPVAQTLFDAGLREAQKEQARAAYDESVANYRQTVLDRLPGGRGQSRRAARSAARGGLQAEAVRAAREASRLATNQYNGGHRRLPERRRAADGGTQQRTDGAHHPRPPPHSERLTDQSAGRRLERRCAAVVGGPGATLRCWAATVRFQGCRRPRVRHSRTMWRATGTLHPPRFCGDSSSPPSRRRAVMPSCSRRSSTAVLAARRHGWWRRSFCTGRAAWHAWAETRRRFPSCSGAAGDGAWRWCGLRWSSAGARHACRWRAASRCGTEPRSTRISRGGCRSSSGSASSCCCSTVGTASRPRCVSRKGR